MQFYVKYAVCHIFLSNMAYRFGRVATINLQFYWCRCDKSQNYAIPCLQAIDLSNVRGNVPFNPSTSLISNLKRSAPVQFFSHRANNIEVTNEKRVCLFCSNWTIASMCYRSSTVSANTSHIFHRDTWRNQILRVRWSDFIGLVIRWVFFKECANTR